MARTNTTTVYYDKTSVQVAAVPEVRKDGLYYEINIPGYPRFFMSWSPLGRFDLAPGEEVKLPYSLVLAGSDMLENLKGR